MRTRPLTRVLRPISKWRWHQEYNPTSDAFFTGREILLKLIVQPPCMKVRQITCSKSRRSLEKRKSSGLRVNSVKSFIGVNSSVRTIRSNSRTPGKLKSGKKVATTCCWIANYSSPTVTWATNSTRSLSKRTTLTIKKILSTRSEVIVTRLRPNRHPSTRWALRTWSTSLVILVSCKAFLTRIRLNGLIVRSIDYKSKSDELRVYAVAKCFGS